MSNPKGYRHPGDYNLDTCFLTLFDGTQKEIGGIASEINVHQDMSSHYMTCSVVMDDATDLLGNYVNGFVGAINGLGTLTLKFKTASDDFDPREMSFGIYKITNRARINEKEETYVIHGISEEAYYTRSRKISRAYGKGSGGLISNMITGIHKEFFNTKKKLDVDKTKGLHKFVIPNMSVDDTIEFMRVEADSTYRAPYYFFYETFEGFNFKDLNTLVEKEPIEKYRYLPMNMASADQKDSNIDATIIMSFSQKNEKDYLTKINKGQFKSKTINIDIHRKKKTEIVFDYEKNIKKFSTISNAIYPSYEIDDNAYVNMITSRTGHDADTVMSAESHVPKRINERKSFRTSYRETFFNQMLSVTIPGDSNVQAGDTIDLDIPKATVTEEKSEDRKADKYLSGKYLVARVRHKMQGEMYTTEMDCVRDAGDKL